MPVQARQNRDDLSPVKSDDMAKNKEAQAGVGLDCGTMNFVAARKNGQNVETKRVRDAFLDLDPEHKKMLKLSQTSFAEVDGRLLVIGDEALSCANLFNREARRPMSGGVMNSGEVDAQQVISLMMKQVLGDPVKEGERCCYSVPAPAIDVVGSDVTYHKAILGKILRELGYQPEASNEAQAVIFSECLKENFSGIGISYGCLTPDTCIFTRNGLVPISQVQENDSVLTRLGTYSKVSRTWSRPHVGPIYRLSFFGNPNGVGLTGNHEVWVHRDGTWQWLTAEKIVKGDVVGEPFVTSNMKERPALSIKDRDGNGPVQNKVLDWSIHTCRFLGYFLADGHLGSEDRGSIWFDFGPDQQAYADDVKLLAKKLFDRSVCFVPHGSSIRCEMSHKGLCTWLRNHCYEEKDGKKVKRFPLEIESLNSSAVQGLVVGMVRGDGWDGKYHSSGHVVNFGNSSLSLISAFHLLVGRMGLTSTITVRDPRGSKFKDGREIKAESCQPEWSVHVTGDDGLYLRQIISDLDHSMKSDSVWRDGGFRCTKIKSIDVEEYDGLVYDLTVNGDPSFSAPYITLHNSGMTNVCLNFNAMSALEFSIGKGGDWIDEGSSRAVNTTKAKMCALKESGIDIANPNSRDQEAISFFVESLIDYSLKGIIDHFHKVNREILIPKPVPIVVSGGTSLAGGFLDKFKERFELLKGKFPVEISDIRHAEDPMTAVSTGLLLLSQMDD